MTTVLLVRHGLTHLTGPVLSGWTPGLHLDERGVAQAARLASQLARVPLAAVVTSPLERCRDTAAAILDGRAIEATVDERLGEARYGDWTGRELKALVRDPLWKLVQSQPSAVTFPNGEAMRDVQSRALAGIRDWNERLGRDAIWLACSHADVIKSIVADALGLHLDQFQRIAIAPASLTVVRYEPSGATVLRVNDMGGSVEDLLPRQARRRGSPRGRGPRPAVADGIGGTSRHG